MYDRPPLTLEGRSTHAWNSPGGFPIQTFQKITIFGTLHEQVSEMAMFFSFWSLFFSLEIYLVRTYVNEKMN